MTVGIDDGCLSMTVGIDLSAFLADRSNGILSCRSVGALPHRAGFAGVHPSRAGNTRAGQGGVRR